MQETSEIGLRERKRIATRRAIEEAAVDIAFSEGYEATTVEAIAAQAGVSLRTFFNYFPNKDSAIAGLGLRVSDKEIAQRLLVESEPRLLMGILRIFERAAEEDDASGEILQRRRVLYKKYPSLLRHHFTHVDVLESELAEVVVAYLKERPQHRHLADTLTVEEEARLAVTMFGSAIRYSTRTREASDLDTAGRVAHIGRTIDLMSEFRAADR